MFSGLRTCIYLVSDLDRAKAWYTELLGFGPYFDEPFYVGYNVGGYELGLQPTDSDAGKSPSVLTYWAVDDIQAAYQRLLAAGAKPHDPPQNVGGEIWVASVYDPFGNVVGLIVNPEFRLP